MVQGFAHVARQPVTSARTSDEVSETVRRTSVAANCTSWTGAVLRVAAVKGWRYDGGMDHGYEDLRGHEGTCVYRRRAIAETGWLRHWASLDWVLHVEVAGSGSMWYVCKNAGARTSSWARMGGCVQCCWAGRFCCHGTGLCQGSGALSDRGITVYAGALNCVGRTTYRCVHLCT